MKRGVKITLWALCGIAATLLAALCILLCLGFRFSSGAAVHAYYRESTVIHTDGYDFYFNPVDGENTEGYSDGHVAVKKYAFLYKQLPSEGSKYKDSQILVTGNGETVGYMYSYPAKQGLCHLIHWAQEPLYTEDGASTYTLKYWTDEITLDGETVKLQNTCFFTSEAPIEALTVKGTEVFVVHGTAKGKYWSDASVMVINTASDVDAEKITAHYDNGGMIVVRDWQLAGSVQALLKANVAADATQQDLAAVFYKTKSGALGSGFVQGGSSEVEREIDEMIERAKANQ